MHWRTYLRCGPAARCKHALLTVKKSVPPLLREVWSYAALPTARGWPPARLWQANLPIRRRRRGIARFTALRRDAFSL